MKIISTTPRTKSNSSNSLENYQRILAALMSKNFQISRALIRDEMINELNGFSIAIVGDDELDESFFNQSNTLKIDYQMGIRNDNIDYQAASKNKIKIVNTPNILGKHARRISSWYYLIRIKRK